MNEQGYGSIVDLVRGISKAQSVTEVIINDTKAEMYSADKRQAAAQRIVQAVVEALFAEGESAKPAVVMPEREKPLPEFPVAPLNHAGTEI